MWKATIIKKKEFKELNERISILPQTHPRKLHLKRTNKLKL